MSKAYCPACGSLDIRVAGKHFEEKGENEFYYRALCKNCCNQFVIKRTIKRVVKL